MLEDISWIEFHSSLFHAGKNFGTKVDVRKVPGLGLQYDTEKSLFYVTYQGKVASVPQTSVFMWVDADEASPEVVNAHQTHDVTAVANAQVETPTTHVFEGRGKGRTKQ